MTQWYSRDLGDGVAAHAASDQIKQAFLSAFAMAGNPVDMAIFSCYNLKRNIVTVYFSPGASTFAKMNGAVPCHKPEKEHGLGLLVGDQRCLQLFYPFSE